VTDTYIQNSSFHCISLTLIIFASLLIHGLVLCVLYLMLTTGTRLVGTLVVQGFKSSSLTQERFIDEYIRVQGILCCLFFHNLSGELPNKGQNRNSQSYGMNLALRHHSLLHIVFRVLSPWLLQCIPVWPLNKSNCGPGQ
jgi:hypothetical protein